jgi:uncharacterized membrane protein YhdT
MNNAEQETGGFIRQRQAGIIAIAAALPVMLLLWLAIAYLLPPLAGMDGLGRRMLFTLKCCCLAVLFCLVTGVEAVAHERLSSPAFDPLSGFETRRLQVNQRYLQNTLEQTLCFRRLFLVLQPILQTASRCAPSLRRLLFGYLRASPSGLATIGVPQCGAWVRRAWLSA